MVDKLAPTSRHRVTLGDRVVYEWSQTVTDVDIFVPLPPVPNLKAKMLYVNLKREGLEFGLINTDPYMKVCAVATSARSPPERSAARSQQGSCASTCVQTAAAREGTARSHASCAIPTRGSPDAQPALPRLRLCDLQGDLASEIIVSESTWMLGATH